MNYGKCLKNPIQLNSIDSSIQFLESLVTEDEGYYIIAHRKYSKTFSESIVDVYELYSSNNKIDELFVSIYFENNLFIPPNGYLFDTDIIENNCISENYIFNNTDDLKKKHTHLQKHLIKSKCINYRYENFPTDMINELYKNNELFFVEDITALIKSINDDIQL